jgi:hypothetical protein
VNKKRTDEQGGGTQRNPTRQEVYRCDDTSQAKGLKVSPEETAYQDAYPIPDQPHPQKGTALGRVPKRNTNRAKQVD